MLKLNKRILLILTVISVLLIIPTSFAEDLGNDAIISDVNDETITADEDIIYVSDGETNGDGSQSSPFNSISDAVNLYNSSVNSNIYIKNGDYKINEQIEINKDITIIGESRENTVLDGQGTSSIFKLTTKSKLTLVNLTFKNAVSSALNIDSGNNVIVDNCIFDNNTGSAIYHKSYFGDLVLNVTDSIFTKNHNSDGGAIYLSRGTLNVTDSVFDGNFAPIGESDASQGGAIYAGGGTLKTVFIDNCVFNNNTAVQGSAISEAADSDFYLLNSVFTNNYAPGSTKYKINSSVVNVKSTLNGINLFLNNNVLANNTLNNEIKFDEKVKVQYLDKNINISADNLEKIYGDDYNFNVKLTDLNGNPISGKLITVVLTNSYDKTTYTLSNNTNNAGIAIISLSGVRAGKYNAVSSFAGDGQYDDINIQNSIYIRTENDFNIVFEQDYVNLTEGDSYNATLYIYDEYMVPSTAANGYGFSVDWFEGEIHRVIDVGSVKVDGNKLVYDINRCHLVTSDNPYHISFNITNIGSAVLTVSLSKNITNIDENLEVLYVSKEGSDENGTGSKDKPLATVQMALIANANMGGNRTIIVGEGVYEISTFTVMENVTVIGEKSKTVFKQTVGILGMFEIDRGNTVRLVNITFTGGRATSEPESLIHVTDESVAYIDGCEFYENYAMDGGAIALSRGAKAYVTNSYFHNNMANTSAKVYGIGGAIYVHDYSYLLVSNSLFVNNTARDGGAIFLGFGSEADIIDSTFENNTAIVTTLGEGGGGAIFTRSSNINIYNSSFITNYAELYGGALYLDYGDIEIYKSYFENNNVKRSGDEKGNTIESSYTSYSNITMNYCVVISDDDSSNYAVSIHNIDENHTADTYYNYWKVSCAKSTAGSVNEVKIQISVENEYIYTGDVVEFNVEFVAYNPENGTSPLNDSVHDLALNLIPTIGEVLTPNIVIKDNLAKFIYNATTVGSETIYFENIYNHTKYKFDVLDGSDKIDLAHSIDISVNKTSTITVTFGNDIKSNITVRINDEDYSVEVKDSKAVLEVETAPGDYSVEVIFTGDDTYKGFIDKDSFNVAKYSSQLIVEDITVYFNGKFEATLKDGDGNVISGENINININGTDYVATTDENGTASLDLNLASVGQYDVVTTFEGNSLYNSTSADSKITVIYTNVNVEAQDEVITPLNGSFTVTVLDDNNNTINGVNVVITINGTEYNLKTVNDGKVTLDLTDNGFEAGKFDVDVKVLESGVYSSANATAVITVEKIPAVISTKDISVFSNNGELVATLTDANGNPISNKTLVFDLNGNSTEIITDENGQSVFKLNLDAGNYTVVVKLKDDKIFAAEDSSAVVSVSSNAITINAPDVTVYYSNGKFTVGLSDVNGNPISSEVIVVLNGQNLIVYTGDDGLGSTPLNLPIGTYYVLVQFKGNNIFKPLNTTSKITVLSSIESQDLTRAYMSPYDFEAKLLDSNGNPLANEKVTLVVNGKEYYTTTDSQGVLKLNANFTAGKYAITIINPSTGEETANYANIVERITDNADIKMYYGAGKSYQVRVYGDDGNVTPAGEAVIFNLNGKTYTEYTDANGYASLKIESNPGTYAITATYKGVSVSNKVVVKQVLKAKNISKKKAKKIKYSAKLVDKYGKAVKGKVIKFKIKGKTYKAKTNKKGVAKVSLKNLKVGKYKIKISYGKIKIKKTIKIKK